MRRGEGFEVAGSWGGAAAAYFPGWGEFGGELGVAVEAGEHHLRGGLECRLLGFGVFDELRHCQQQSFDG